MTLGKRICSTPVSAAAGTYSGITSSGSGRAPDIVSARLFGRRRRSAAWQTSCHFGNVRRAHYAGRGEDPHNTAPCGENARQQGVSILDRAVYIYLYAFEEATHCRAGLFGVRRWKADHKHSHTSGSSASGNPCHSGKDSRLVQYQYCRKTARLSWYYF